MSKEQTQQVIIAPGVIETIVALAVAQVDGVASVGGRSQSGLLSGVSKKHGVPGVLILEDEGLLKVDLRIWAYYGFQLQELAKRVRAAVADALLSQAGISIDRVDITIDGLAFRA
ncbi:MAG: Asp23/Gls24 family envelope stress response protein [Coriobacteriales bacterium]|jgi:uncharacterized alkaline shock family protein YloU|nr:Asp23/Gls24 family envelope stress response protein [Coriobacteriales bacterium]